jgi:hypothetical protein
MKTQDTSNMNEQVPSEEGEQPAASTDRKGSLNLKIRTRVGMEARTQLKAGIVGAGPTATCGIQTHSL